MRFVFLFMGNWAHRRKVVLYSAEKRKYIKTKDDNSILKYKRISMAAIRDLYLTYATFPTPLFSLLTTFKGAQAWDFRERVFYTYQTCTGTARWLGDWQKNMAFRKLEPLLEGFRYEYLI
jgi:hypothetical protein